MTMTTAATQRDELTTRGRAAAIRLADLVATIDADEAESAVPGTDWSVIETAVHVVNLYGRVLGDQRRSASPAETAALNAQCIEEYVGRDPKAVSARIAADAATCWDEVLPLVPDDLEIPFHAGARSTIVPILGVLLMEMLVHGDDIASAIGREWAIDEMDAWLALVAITSLLPAWRRPDAPADDTIALVGPTEVVVRITSTRTAAHVELATTIDPADRVARDMPSTALLGMLGRRPASEEITDLAARFGPF